MDVGTCVTAGDTARHGAVSPAVMKAACSAGARKLTSTTKLDAFQSLPHNVLMHPELGAMVGPASKEVHVRFRETIRHARQNARIVMLEYITKRMQEDCARAHRTPEFLPLQWSPHTTGRR